MTNHSHRKVLATFLLATSIMATSMPAVACEGASRLQSDVNGSDRYVTGGNHANSPTVLHPLERDPYFPRR